MERLGTVVILDFGAQYSQLIAKKIRQLGFYSIVLPHVSSMAEISTHNPGAIVFSGGPASIYDTNAPVCDNAIFTSGIPILGICYGMQLIANHFGGKVMNAPAKEYGQAHIIINSKSKKHPLFKDLGKPVVLLNKLQSTKISSSSKITKATNKKATNKTKTNPHSVWMSHGDEVDAKKLPQDFDLLATSGKTVAVIANENKKIYGVQFHPEVEHTCAGDRYFYNFLAGVAKLKPNWSMPSFIKEEVLHIRKTVGDKKVILALSGGVDSTVLAVLLHAAIGDRLLCVFVDNGLLRLGEARQVVNMFNESFAIPLKYINAKRYFLNKLRWIRNPEKKRRVIGKAFIKILKRESRGFYFLAQGTLYPDVIESVSHHGPSSTIKTHHNRVSQVLKLKKAGRLLEPFAELFKDEVREIGRQLGVPDSFIHRQPFPGPGLAVRILGRVTKPRLVMLKKADYFFQKELEKHPDHPKLWQSFAVLLPIRSVGVVGDKRSYGYTIVLRAVSAVDGMTADFEILDKPSLTRITNKIIGEVNGITRVVWDITSKPPATIEWE